MLINNNVFNLLSQMKLEFHLETTNDIQFKMKTNNLKIEEHVEEIYNIVQFNFTVKLSDQNLSIPKDFSSFAILIDTFTSNETEVIFEFKKRNFLREISNTNTVIYFNFLNLEKYLENLDFSNFQEFIFNNKPYSCIISVNGGNPALINNYVKVVNLKEVEKYKNPLLTNTNNYKERLSEFKGSSKSIHHKIIPDQLYFPLESSTPILEIFNKWCSFLCLSYISSNVEKLNDSKKYQFHFNGQKKITLENTYDLSKSHEVKEIFGFYEWIYSDKIEDKLKIFQNLLPLHINLASPINLELFESSLQELVNSTKENFDFYIQENIRDYLDERRKIEDIVINSSNLISAEISKITDLLIRTLTGVFLSVISSVLILLIRSPLQSTIGYALYLFGIIILLSIVYIIYFSRMSVKIAYSSFNDRINEYYLFLSTDRRATIKKTVKNRKKLFNRVVITTIIIMVFILFFIFSLGMYFQNGENIVISFLIQKINLFTQK